MAVTLHRFPEFGVTLALIRDHVDPAQLLDGIAGLGPDDDRPLINYVDPSADMADVDLASIAELKRAVGVKMRSIFGDRIFVSAIVCDSRANEPLLRLWTSYVGLDREHPSNPRLVSSLKAACDYLQLPDAARKRIAETIQTVERDAARRPRTA